jgi:hypothetical protein
MVTIKVNIDRTELEDIMGLYGRDLDEACHGQVDRVLSLAEEDLEDYITDMIRNHDYDLALTFSEAIDKIEREHLKKGETHA